MENPAETAPTLTRASTGGAVRPPLVCAVVLTFNRVPMLQRCLEKIQKQTRRPDCVLVVDNHSSDNTQEYLESITPVTSILRVLRTPENLGPAGGFAEGISWGVEEGYDYLWLLDDDSDPDPACLEIQLEEMSQQRDTIIYPRNIDQSGRTANYPAWRGPLIPRQVIQKGGVPNKELFWSKEDTEYFQWRLPRIYGVKVTHSTRAVARFTAANSMTRSRPAWKYYYWGRNTVYYRVWVQRPWKWWRYRKLLVTIARLWLRVVFLEDRKLAKARYLSLGICHGLQRRLGKVVDPARS